MLGIPQALSRVLQLQSMFSPFVRFSSNTTNSPTQHPSSIPDQMAPEITQILSFWFDQPNSTTKWFRGGDAFDAEIRTHFSDLVVKARTTKELDHWTKSPQGSLALVILLDQFPRNLYRSSAEAHASDTQACNLAINSIAKEFDRRQPQISNLQSLFFYLPLMHDESVVSQIACVALMEGLLARCRLDGDMGDKEAHKFVENSLGHAKGHRDTIFRFGRFPGRNGILGRESTEEEVKFLQEHPGGFY